MWQRNVTSADFIFPSDGKVIEEGSGLINVDGAELLQDLNKLLSVILANVLNSKIFNKKRKGNVLAGLFPERSSACHWGVAEFGKVELESVVGKFSGLFQAWYTLLNIYVNPPISGKCVNVVFGDNFFGGDGTGNFHILVPIHRCVVILL